jgi:uncharacterized protein (TIGR02996 family)
MSDDGYRREVLARPEDDAPRVAYAAALERRGDPRGEFIRIQLELARQVKASAPAGADVGLSEYVALLRRSQELESAHGEAWRAGLPEYVTKPRFERGFIESAQVDARAFVDDPQALFAAAPILTLHLKESRAVMAPLALTSQLQQLVGMSFWRNKLTDHDVIVLSQSGHLARLKWLDLRRNQIGTDGVEALFISSKLPGLRWVGLAFNKAPDPADVPGGVDDDRILDYDQSPYGKELEARYGERRWLHYHVEFFSEYPPTSRLFVGEE